uniref:Calponin-homology (CH) domain-containing protein n=1 Tax=Panagrolaimus davidi TaxID=227884 RepID=A0A914R5L5_9BILA
MYNYTASKASDDDIIDGELYYEKRRIQMLRDEYIAIQKKTFTKWINSYLVRGGQDEISDLFVDIRDGTMLLKFLEIIYSTKLQRPSPKKTRIHCCANINISLEFLRIRGIYYENLSSEDIFDGKPTLILGLIWTIILRSVIEIPKEKSIDQKTIPSATEIVLIWCQKMTADYEHVNIKNFTTSWRDGLAFNALIHAHRPELIEYDSLLQSNTIYNLQNALNVAEKYLGISKLFDAEDIATECPDNKLIFTYVSTYYNYFVNFRQANIQESSGTKVLEYNNEKYFETDGTARNKLQNEKSFGSEYLQNEDKRSTNDDRKIKSNFCNIPKKLSNYDPDIQAVGIDLGTTECCTAVMRKNGPEFVVLDPITAGRTMPSYVAFDEKEPKCGQIVVDRMRHQSKCSVFDSKRIIGKTYETITIDPLWPFQISENDDNVLLTLETYNGRDIKSPEEVTAALLRHIKTATEAFQSKNLNTAVITVPSEFSDKQKEATKMSAEYAGWQNIHFIPEPLAAAYAYFSEIDMPENANILICDCGGGTVDICVGTVTTNELYVLCYVGDSHLGGRDFDNVLFTHFNGILLHKYKIDVMQSSKKYVLRQKCQNIKHQLSAADKDWLDVDDFDCSINEVIQITKLEFEEMTTPLLVRIEEVIRRAVAQSNIATTDINYVFQVGGGCRMPMLKKLLLDTFPAANHQSSLYPDWIVAHGAALYAYYLKNNVAQNHSRKFLEW